MLKRLITGVFCMLIYLSSFAFNVQAAHAGQHPSRRIADNIFAVQNVEQILAVAKHDCITGIESVGPSQPNTPFYVYVVPGKNHTACKDVPKVLPTEVEASETIEYLGSGLFKIQNQSDFELLIKHFYVLDTEPMPNGILAVTRTR